MRVLLVIDGNELPRFGGPPRVVLGSAIALAQAGHDVTVLSSLLAGDKVAVDQFICNGRECGVNFVFIEPLRATDIWLNSRQASLLESIKASEVIHCHGISAPFAFGRGGYRLPTVKTLSGLCSRVAVAMGRAQIAVQKVDCSHVLWGDFLS